MIEAVVEVIQTDIRNNINEVSLVAIEVDETTDVTQKAQISVFCHLCETLYLAMNAFWGFDDVSDHRRPSATAQYGLGVL